MQMTTGDFWRDVENINTRHISSILQSRELIIRVSVIKNKVHGEYGKWVNFNFFLWNFLCCVQMYQITTILP